MRFQRTYIKRVIVSLLTVVFFANITLAHSVDFHTCQGELQSIAFFGKKASCNKMMEAQMTAPRSCCDLKKEESGLSFKQKSCCENVQLVQDNVLNKPSLELDQQDAISLDFINDFVECELQFSQLERVTRAVEIPPPPNIHQQHSQEYLQVFTI